MVSFKIEKLGFFRFQDNGFLLIHTITWHFSQFYHSESPLSLNILIVSSFIEHAAQNHRHLNKYLLMARKKIFW